MQPERTPSFPEPCHWLRLQDRTNLTITAVQEVTAYDCYAVTLETGCGTLLIGGEELKVLRFSVESGEAEITGRIEYLQYQDRKAHTGIWQRLQKGRAATQR